MAKQIPVYLFIGFLESGKTRMIQETMEDPNFNSGDRTLIIQCEEGEEELDLSSFARQNVWLEKIEQQEELAAARLIEWQKANRIERVIIEYNGMWQLRTLFENLPTSWFIFQCMMFADATTFLAYNTNLRSLMVDKLMSAETVVFNRAAQNRYGTPDLDQELFHKIVRASSRSADIIYEFANGDMVYDDIEDPLPFDKTADVIEIADRDYALFYRDLSEDLEAYAGKTVKFKGIAAKDFRLPGNTFIIGRHIMTCCADDIAYGGLACVFDDKKSVAVKNRGWYMITAEIRIEPHMLYEQKGPVLHGITYAITAKPDPEVATFY